MGGLRVELDYDCKHLQFRSLHQQDGVKMWKPGSKKHFLVGLSSRVPQHLGMKHHYLVNVSIFGHEAWKAEEYGGRMPYSDWKIADVLADRNASFPWRKLKRRRSRVFGVGGL
jgi:hypothetical protein